MASLLTHEKSSKCVDVAIIGAGISGLSLAFWLTHYSQGASVELIEKNPSAGGWIQTMESPTGQLYERGPRSIRLIGERARSISNLIDLLGLSSQVVTAEKAVYRRYVRLYGKMVELPSSIVSFFTNPLGLKLLFSLIREPIRSMGRMSRVVSPSFHEFIHDHFGTSSTVLKLANAMTSGIWASEASYISLKAAFPWLYQLSLENRSVVLGAFKGFIKRIVLKRRRRSSVQRGIITFSKGMGSLTKALTQSLISSKQCSISLDSFIEEVSFCQDSKQWSLRIKEPHGSKCVLAKKVVLACNPMQLSSSVQRLLYEKAFLSPEGQHFFLPRYDEKSQYPSKASSVVTVSLGWGKDYFDRCEDGRYVNPGFGVLAPKSEDDKVLGIIFESVVFPSQNSSMKTRLSVMIGGTRFSEALIMSDQELISLALSRVKDWLRIEDSPQEVFVSRARHAIPLPLPGKDDVLCPYVYDNETESLYCTSAFISGVAIPDCVDAAEKLAKALSCC